MQKLSYCILLKKTVKLFSALYQKTILTKQKIKSP